MQEELFGLEEYRQVAAYYYRMARHPLFKSQTYRERSKARYGIQLSLFARKTVRGVRPSGRLPQSSTSVDWLIGSARPDIRP
jgi:hypothetical protein